MDEFLLGGVLFFVHYGTCWYFYSIWMGNFELDLTSHLFYKFIAVVSTILLYHITICFW